MLMSSEPTTLITPSVEERPHADVSPSKLNYLDPDVGGCYGYLSDSGGSAAAEEGTFRHEIMDRVIAAWKANPHRTTLQAELFLLRRREQWDDETEYAVAFCCARLDPYFAKAKEVRTEQRVEVRDADGKVCTWGYFDVLVLFHNGSALLVDFKFGQIPVEPAPSNRQGMAYTLAVLQAERGVGKIAMMFLQPAAGIESTAIFTRQDLPRLVDTVPRLVHEVETFRTWLSGTFDLDYSQAMNPGDSCTYCRRARDCSAYLHKFELAARAAEGLMTLPAEMNLDAINTPEKAAVAAYWVDFLTDKLPEIKRKAHEVAVANGGTVEYRMGDQTIRYEVRRKKCDRVLGPAAEVMLAVKDLLAPEEVLGAANVQLGALQTAMVSVLVTAAVDRGEKLSQKAALAQADAILEAGGVLSQPDGSVPVFARAKKVGKQKQVKNKD